MVFFLLFFLPSRGNAESVLKKIEEEQQTLFKAVSPSVVFIVSGKGFGSGFYVAPNLILTNHHVVGRRKEVNIVLRGGKRIKGKVLKLPKELDLALLEVKEAGAPLPLMPKNGFSVGSWVGAIGHGEGGIWTFTSGMVSNIYTDKKKGTIIQTQIPINQGNSGGPIIDRRGYVIGVATAKSTRGENLNFAIPVEDAMDVFSKLRIACTLCLKIKAQKGTKVFLDGRLLKEESDYVLLVKPGTHKILSIKGNKSTKKIFEFPKTKRIELKPEFKS